MPRRTFAPMQVHYGPGGLPAFRKAVLTIGTFDGVHAGHRQILSALIEEAGRVGGESVVLTFDPHPRTVVRPDSPPELITTLPEKLQLLEAAGVAHTVVMPFTPEFSEQSADSYIRDFLVGLFHPHTLIIGYDHRFGKGRSGGYELLEARKEEFGFRLVEIPQQLLNEIAISSTRIRNALKRSDIATANELLGYAFSFEGEVIHGDKLGRTIGYPTANLSYTDKDKIRPGEGVYAARALADGESFGGMLSIGKRPTLNDFIERVEINLFDFDRDIYGQNIRVEILTYLRGQEKYPSLEELKEQLHKDKEDSLDVLRSTF